MGPWYVGDAVAGSDDDDAGLHARWLEGDRGAGRELFRRHGRAIIRFIRSKFPGVAEDLSQEVFARFFRTTKGDVDVRPFLFGIARNVVFEEVRRRQPGADVGVTSIVDLQPPSSTQMLERHRLLQALQVLPLDHQVVLELHYWEGMASEELGVALGVTASAARSRVAAARDRLRASLQKRFPKRPETDFVDLERWAHQLRAAIDER